MHVESRALQKTYIWHLVARTPDMIVIGSKWVYKTTLKSECSTKCLEERCVAQDYSQIRGIVFYETSKPVSLQIFVLYSILLLSTIGKFINLMLKMLFN